MFKTFKMAIRGVNVLLCRFQSTASTAVPLPIKPAKKSFFLKFVLGSAVATTAYVYGPDAFFKMKKLYKGQAPGKKKERVVVLGTGWGAVPFMRHLDRDEYDIICVSPRNFFLMTPLLPSVAVGTVETRTVCEAIRPLIGDDVAFFEMECVDIDPAKKVIHCHSDYTEGPKGSQATRVDKMENIPQESQLSARAMADNKSGSSSRKIIDSTRTRPAFSLEYDKLVIAIGSENNTFNTPGVSEHAHFLKELTDANRIRAAISDAFESAVLPSCSEEERKRLLHFIVVGGGPTGIEFAGELHDMVVEDLTRYFPKLCMDDVKITVVEALDHVLTMFDKTISQKTEEHFARESIEIVPKTLVKKVNQKSVEVFRNGKMESWPCAMVVWSTGIKARPLIHTLRAKIGEKQSNTRALLVDEYLQVLGGADIFAIGDCSTVEQPKLRQKFVELFHEAGPAGPDRTKLDSLEFASFIRKNVAKYPQLELISKEVNEVLTERKNFITKDEFKALLEKADNRLRALPATAQVAAQQGHYLANFFNGDHRAFRYRHMGSLAYIGGDAAVVDFTGTSKMLDLFELGPQSGRGSYYLWRSFYLSEMFTNRTRWKLANDWISAKIFGRDISRT